MLTTSATHSGRGPKDEDDVLPYARENDLVLLHDDAMPAYEVASSLIAMIDAYPNPEAFEGREILDVWA